MPGVWGVSARSAVAKQWALGFEGVARMGRGLGGTGGSHLTDFRTSPRVISGVEYQKTLASVSSRASINESDSQYQWSLKPILPHKHWFDTGTV